MSLHPWLTWVVCPTCNGARNVWTWTRVSAAALTPGPQMCLWQQCPRCLGTGFVVAQQEPTFDQKVEALKKLELLVVLDLFMTETAELAHYVLPGCTHLEKNGLAYSYNVCHGMPYLMLRKKAIGAFGAILILFF